jgi:hypothetical protein
MSYYPVKHIHIKESELSFGMPFIDFPTLKTRYPHVTDDYYFPEETDPVETLEPFEGTETVETTRFERYITLFGTALKRDVELYLWLTGTGHIYVDTVTATYNYRLYIILYETENFFDFKELVSQKQILSYSRSQAASAGWVDEGEISYMGYHGFTLDARNFLVLYVRGTSWTTSDTATSSIGLKSGNFKIRGQIFI